MRVALVHDYLLEIGGAERVLMVLAEIFPEAPIYTLLCDYGKWTKIFPVERIRVSSLHQLPGFLRGRRRWLLPFLPIAAETFNLRDFNLVISSSAGFAKGIITNSRTVHVSYCHTPTRFLWDLHHFYVKDAKLGFLKKPLLHWLRLWDLAAAARVDYFIANSKNTSRRIRKYYGREAETIYPPVDLDWSVSESSPEEKLQVPFEDYFLVVSRLLSYKRVDLAVQAFSKLGLPLVIIGDGPEKRRLEKMAAKNVKFLGAHYGRTKYLYLKHCQAFIFPGDEDFGIAPVEAMMLGRPVLTQRIGGLLETVIEGKTGEFFDESSPESLAEGLGRLKANMRNYDAEFIKKHAQKFGKERFIKEIKEFIDKCIINFKTKNQRPKIKTID
jgi:glycosyltransferase involved in cell wall biosynthesis